MKVLPIQSLLVTEGGSTPILDPQVLDPTTIYNPTFEKELV